MDLKLIFLVCLIIVESGLTAMTLSIIAKYDGFMWYDINRLNWMPERCEICLSFWICAFFYITGLLLGFFPSKLIFYLSPFCAAPIARIIWLRSN